MKKLILLTVSVLIFSISSIAQNNVQLTINHRLGDVEYGIKTAAKNNLDNDFEAIRLEYYISEISIVHDGGVETAFDDLWVLANADETTVIDLGDSGINSVEMVKWHIGVSSEYNHLDPSSYPSSHPLAHQIPDMHWGWVGGYRFVAFDGDGGSGFDQPITIHGLGDINYFVTEIPVNVEAVNNEVDIYIDADYTRALEDIEVNSGLVIHGDYDEAQQILENFRDLVFTEGSEISSTIDFSEVSKFEVFPNPMSGYATILLESSQHLNYKVSVTDILGQEVMLFDAVNGSSTIDLELNEAGFYFVNLMKEGYPVITKKLISK